MGSTETKEGTLLATLLDAFAECEERSVIMARVKANVESKKARGLCVGNTGLGETKVIRDGLNYIERDEEEAQKLRSSKIEREKRARSSELQRLAVAFNIDVMGEATVIPKEDQDILSTRILSDLTPVIMVN